VQTAVEQIDALVQRNVIYAPAFKAGVAEILTALLEAITRRAEAAESDWQQAEAALAQAREVLRTVMRVVEGNTSLTRLDIGLLKQANEALSGSTDETAGGKK
jgi:hypothetical protein